MYMIYTVIGILFVIICGFELAYKVIWLAPSELEDPELEGHSVKFNQTGVLVPVVNKKLMDFYQSLYLFKL